MLGAYLDVQTAVTKTTPRQEVTVTATVTNTSAIPPSSLTMTVGTTSADVPVNPSGVATAVVAIHPALAGYATSATLSGVGIPAESVTISAGLPTQGIQVVYLPKEDVYLLAPTKRSVLRAYYSGILSEGTRQDTLSRSLQNLYLVDSIALHALVVKILASLMQPFYTPITLTADEQNAVTDMLANLIPSFTLHLGTIYPVGGERVEQYQSAIDMAPVVEAAASAYAHDIATLPNLT
ncbi:MAG: hypothetical protein ACYCOR_10790 [Acidobacteriaceae bacterium]